MSKQVLYVTDTVSLSDWEVEFRAIRAQGAGGQNVNKVSSAIHLRFPVRSSSLPEECKQRILNSNDHRLSQDGIVIIKAQRFRTQEQNRLDALERLRELILSALIKPKARKATRPTRASKVRRVEGKVHRGKIKALRSRWKGE